MKGLGGILIMLTLFMGIAAIAFFGITMFSKTPAPNATYDPQAAESFTTGMNMFKMVTPIIGMLILLCVVAAAVFALYLLFGRQRGPAW